MSYNNLPSNIIEALRAQYPDGYANFVKKIPKPNNDFFYAITVDTEDATYLVKVNVKIDNINPEKLDEQLFTIDNEIKGSAKLKDTDDNENNGEEKEAETQESDE